MFLLLCTGRFSECFFFFQNEALYIALTSLLDKMEAADPDAASRYKFL
jgi:hypothetical protein